MSEGPPEPDKDATAKSEPDGIARLALGAQDDLVLVAKRGGDVALLPRDSGWWGDAYGWTAVPRTETLRWMVFDDRHMYRPDEEVHFKGFVRRWDARKGGSANGFAAQGVKAKYKVIDSRNNTVLEGEVALSDLGAFDGSFNLPKTINLGAPRIQFQADGPIVSGGCGGNRDPGKRPLMSGVAARLADIARAAPGSRVIGDRAEAIRAALAEADARDVVLIAGKGHETYQEIGGCPQPFSDADCAAAALAGRARASS